MPSDKAILLIVGRSPTGDVEAIADQPRHMRVRRQVTGLIDLYNQAGISGKTGVEVGCHWGESAEIAAQFFGVLHCVDPWSSGSNEAAFDARMGRFTNVTKHKMVSTKAATQFADSSIDLVYIDARHNYDNVRADILAWFPKVVSGGWISGHDYDHIETHVGVVKAVDEILGKPELRFDDMSFLFRKTAELIARVGEFSAGGKP